jgi:hypothetical protein
LGPPVQNTRPRGTWADRCDVERKYSGNWKNENITCSRELKRSRGRKNHMLSTLNFYQNAFGTTELLIRKMICQKCSLVIHRGLRVQDYSVKNLPIPPMRTARGARTMNKHEAKFYGLKSLRNGPSLRSLAASVNARNLLNPVVAAPRPSAAARASTSSRFVVRAPVKAAMLGVIDTAGVGTGANWTDVVAAGGATVGATVGCFMAGASLLESSSIACWSAFFKPCDRTNASD